MKLNELITDFEIWTTNEEQSLLKKLTRPVALSSLSEQDQFRVESLIRKSLITKVGHEQPYIVINEKLK